MVIVIISISIHANQTSFNTGYLIKLLDKFCANLHWMIPYSCSLLGGVRITIRPRDRYS